MATYPNETTSNLGSDPSFLNILKQVDFLPTTELSKKDTGKKIANELYRNQTNQSTGMNFFTARSLRWITLMKWANGTQDMTEFLDYFNVSSVLGDKAYVKIDTTPIMVGPQFVETLIDSMGKNEEFPCVYAIDEDSVDQKEQRQLDALFRMHDIETIQAVQQQAGIHLEPPNAYVPDSELSAKVYFEFEDRLPKEIKFEKILEDNLTQNQYERVLKRELHRSLLVNNIGVLKIEKKRDGYYPIRKCNQTNVFYSYFQGETGKREIGNIGEFYNLKIRDIRSTYGQSPENPDGLTEKELFELARMSATRGTGVGFGFLWQESFQFYNLNRPWDDYSVYVMDFEIKVNTSDYYVSKVDGYGKENIAPKQGVPQPKSDKATVLKTNKDRWYRGVYCPYADKMIFWGFPDVRFVEPMSTYIVNIPGNSGEYVPSLFERGMEPLKEYAITKLKRKQLISKLRPSGIRIDVASARNIDLGSGNSIPWEEVVRIFDQTGNEIWSSEGLDPHQREAPAIGQTAQDDSIQKIMSLTQTLQSIIMELRQLWGVPMYRDGADVGDRTAAQLADMQNTSSFNVTDFIPNAANQIIEEALYRVCMAEWQDVVKEDKEDSQDLINTRFKVYVRMKQTAYERQLLEQNIQTALKTIGGDGKPIISLKDAFTVRNIKNFKLAEMYLADKIEENERKATRQSQQLQAQNMQVQSQAAQDAAQQQLAMQQQKMNAEKDMAKYIGQIKERENIINGIFMVAAKSPTGELPEYLKPLAAAAISNIMMPTIVENQQMQQGLQMIAQAQQGAQQAQEHPEMQNQEAPDQGQPQPDQSQMQPQPQAA